MAVATSNNLDHFWLPFTPNKYFRKNPKILVSAKGMYYKDADGQDVLDGTAGLWCVNVGHAHPHIVQAVQKQIETFDYGPAFQVSHPAAFDLARRLSYMTPGDLNHAFFTNSGSESVDTALKIALAYHYNRGEPQRVRFIGRERGYHGVGFGGISVGGIPANRKTFGARLPFVDHVRHTLDIKRNAYSRGIPKHGAELAEEIERLIVFNDPSTVAAVIIEPFSGSAGVILPPTGYLERVRKICDTHGVLLIFDEVISGFGRMGTPFGADFFGVTPDMMTLAKGLTSGVIPMGAVMASETIYEAFMQGPEHVIDLFHGYTYSGHPMACAAAHATLDIYEQEGLFARAADLAPAFEEAIHSLKGAPFVQDIRNIGLVGGIDLEPDSAQPGRRGYKVFEDCFHQGVLVRVTSDIIAISPPLVVEAQHFDKIIKTIRNALENLN
ncbi:MAG: aspartate aminotransferase family protein [Pseudomonadota bacterium]